MSSTSDKNRLITADVVAKAWNDAKFRAALLKDPKKVLTKAGIQGIPDGHQIIAHENTASNKYIVLPSNTSPHQYLSSLEDLLTKNSPMPDGHELTLVQNSPDVTHFVLMQRPAGTSGKFDASHVHIAAAAGYESVSATNVNANANVNVNANAAVNVNAAVAVAVAAVVLT